MNYKSIFYEKVNAILKSLDVSVKFAAPVYKELKEVIDLSHLQINTFDYVSGQNLFISTLSASNRINYRYDYYNLESEYDAHNLVARIFNDARDHLRETLSLKTNVFKYNDNFYLISLRRWSSSRYEVNRINTQANAGYNDDVDELRLIFSNDSSIGLVSNDYYFARNNTLFAKLDTLAPIYTKAFDIADIDHFKVADADKNAVFVVRQGNNFGKFYLEANEIAWFERCKATGYLTTSLANYFNERVRIDDNVPTTALVKLTLPKCDDCDKVHINFLDNASDTLNISFRGNCTLCDKCAKDVVDKGIDLTTYTANKFNVGSYGWTPSTLNFGKFESEASPLYMGLEIEVDTQTRNDDVDNDEYDDSTEHYDGHEHNYNSNYAMHLIGGGKDVVHTKNDGSLNNGFEIVSHPMTLAKHLRSMKWQKGMDYLTKMGYKSHNTSTCGLHIHINRNFFGSKAVQGINGGKIAYLMEKNRNEFVKFSRRKSGELDRWARFGDMGRYLSPQVSPRTKSMLSTAFRSQYSPRNKYVALNTIHANTFEFRIFKGTLNFGTLVATMQLVDNLARIVKDIPNNDTMFEALDKISFDDIINYRPYAELTAYWEKRKAV